MPSKISDKELALRKKRVAVILPVLKQLFPDAKMALRYGNNWELLVCVVLSAQCTDKKVNEVTADLFKKYKTLDDYVNADEKEFQQDIRPTGFFRSKTKNILAAAHKIKDEHGGKIPRTMEELTKVPGVGRKTANVILGNAYGVVEGIAVDTHVKRLSRLFKLTHQNDPVKIEKDLMEIVPKKDWFLFTYLMIEYGRKYSPARKRDHGDSPVYVALEKSNLL